MAAPLSEFGQFVFDVFSHTITLAAGCAATVMIGLIEKYVLKRSISIKAEVSVFLAFLFFACFQAWHVQFEKANARSAQQVPIQVTVPPAQVVITPEQPATRETGPMLILLREGKPLNGQVINLALDGNGLFTLSSIRARNDGDRATSTLSLRLYFSPPVSSASSTWQATPSDDASYPSAFYWGMQAIVSPKETWNFPDFLSNAQALAGPTRVKMKVFYGGIKPAEANFTIKPQGRRQ